MSKQDAWPVAGAVYAALIPIIGIGMFAVTKGQFWPGWGALATAIVVGFGVVGFFVGSLFKDDEDTAMLVRIQKAAELQQEEAEKCEK